MTARPPMTDEQKEACYVALDKISTAHRTPQWIPVTERLPEGEEDVLASYEHEDGSRSVDIGWFTTLANPREWRHYAASHRDMIPTHWMPLPAPPTDAK